MKKINIKEIKCGDSVEIEKEMTFEMVKIFSQISEDYNPVHLDKEYASKSRYKKHNHYIMMITIVIITHLLLRLKMVYLSQISQVKHHQGE